MTAAGRTYQDAVTSAFTSLQGAEKRLTQANRSLTIACSYSVSHLVIMPHYNELRRRLGEDVTINVLTSNYEAQSNVDEPNADIAIGYKFSSPGGRLQKILCEKVIPIASPDYIASHKDILDGPIEGWKQLRFLDLPHGTLGWASWSDWFRNHDLTPNIAPSDTFSNFVYLMEAAASGAGIALGWYGFIERQQKIGAIQTIGDQWYQTNNFLWGWNTRQGQNKKAAKICMQFLADLFDEHTPR